MLTSFKRSRPFYKRAPGQRPRSDRVSRRRLAGGFTLVEMLAVVAIICIVTLALFVRQNAFDSSTLLRSLAYSVALSFEQAQTYGTSVRGFTPAGGSTQFAPGYGVYFSSGSSSSFTIFADVNGDHCSAGDSACPSNPGTEDLPAYAINHGYEIYNFCGIWASNSAELSCASTAGAPAGETVIDSSLTSLTVYFKRPDPDAYFYSSTAAGATSDTYSAVYIELVSVDNINAANIRTVKVTPTGEVSVCPLGVNPVSC